MCFLRKLSSCFPCFGSQNRRNNSESAPSTKQITPSGDKINIEENMVIIKPNEPTRACKLLRSCFPCLGRRRSRHEDIDNNPAPATDFEVKEKSPSGYEGTGTIKTLLHDVFPTWANEFGRPPIHRTYFSTILEENEDLDSDDDWGEWDEDHPVIWPRHLFFEEDVQENFTNPLDYEENFTNKVYPWSAFLSGVKDSSVTQDSQHPVSEDPNLTDQSIIMTENRFLSASTLNLADMSPILITELNDLASSPYDDKSIRSSPIPCILISDTNQGDRMASSHGSSSTVQRENEGKIRSEGPVRFKRPVWGHLLRLTLLLLLILLLLMLFGDC